jgi:ATP-dependent Clp protease adapter protein ClpS
VAVKKGVHMARLPVQTTAAVSTVVKPQLYAVTLSNSYVIGDDRELLEMEFVHSALADAFGLSVDRAR